MVERRKVALLGLTCLASLVGSVGQAQDTSKTVLPVEESDTATLPAAGPHRLFLWDAYSTAGATVIDGDDEGLKTLGMVPIARNGGFNISGDASKVYVTETYWTHGDRGTREDLLTTYDGLTLALDKETPLPGRLLVVPKNQQVATSGDEKLAYVYDMIPASSIHVVDIAAGKVLSSVDVPGCALAYPYGARSFATICGDGTIGTTTLTAGGEGKLSFTKPFFDADKDPLFENSVVDRKTGEAWFLSFSGKIYPAKLGDRPVVGQPWSITQAAGLPVASTGVQELAWRPGGGQILAVHRKLRRLYVLMHAGNYWTHKKDGTEVWILDADKKSLIKRIALKGPAKSLTVTQDDKPLLFTYGGEGGSGLAVYDAVTGAMLRGRRAPGFVGAVPGV